VRGRIGFRKVAFRRVGIDWATFLAGSGLVAADGQLTTSVATWDSTLTRYIVVSYDTGNDSVQVPYLDAAAGTVLTGAQVSAIAIKTWDRLLEIVPRFGNGRRLQILVIPRAAGAVYRNRANTADADLDVRGFYGYAAGSSVRGSTDGTNSTTDQILLGGITASAGPNGDGSWTCAAGATTLDLTVSAGALPADTTGTGLRIRFVGNVTAGLANQCRQVHSIIGGTLEVTTTYSAAPANGDTFFLEKPGVNFARIIAGVTDAASGGFQIVGITVSAASGTPVSLNGSVGALTLAFVHSTPAGLTSTANNVVGSLSISNGYTCDDGTFRTVGGCRFAGQVNMLGTSGAVVTITSSAFLAATGRALRIQRGGQISVGRASPCTFVNGCVFDQGGSGTGASGNNVPPAFLGRGAFPTVPRCRVLAAASDGSGVLFGNGSGGLVHGVDITGMGASSCIRLIANGACLGVTDCTGTTGNTGNGVVVSGSGNKIALDPANTVSGTAGDISCGGITGAVVATYADLSLTNFRDESGNDVYADVAGAVTPRLSVDQGIPVSNAEGAALAVGDIVRTNGTSGQVVKAQADTNAHATGVVGVMVTAPANGALGYMVNSGAPYMRFSAAPAAGGLVYLDQANAGQATTTVPPVAATNQKLRLGYHVRTQSGNNSRVAWRAELVAVVSNGAAP